jgi:altronate dehydratase small subunit
MTARRWVYLVPGRDNVATAVQALAPGDRVELEMAGTVMIREPIAFGHKFAVTTIEAGAEVVKYGHSIGQATRPIQAGEHVHVHNVAGKRGRGDLRRKGRGRGGDG